MTKNLISPASLKKLNKIRKLVRKLNPNPWEDDTPQRWAKLANRIRLAELAKVEKKL
jgi:hypothetical protein